MQLNEHLKDKVHIAVDIVDHCNLNCKYCLNCAPIADMFYYDLDQFESEMKQFASWADISSVAIDLMGGEPLLHPQLLDFCRIAKKYFTTVEIYTNGTLLPKMSKKFFDTINDLDVIIAWTKYPINPIITNKIQQILSSKVNTFLIQEHNYMTHVKLDFSDNKLSNEELNLIFDLCRKDDLLHGVLKDGKLLRCCLEYSTNYILKNKFDIQLKDYSLEDNCYNIFNQNATWNGFINYLNTISSFCKYCTSKLTNNSKLEKWALSTKDISEWVYKEK